MSPNTIEGFLDDYADVEPSPKSWTAILAPFTAGYEPDGLPYVKVGKRVLIHIPTTKQ